MSEIDRETTTIQARYNRIAPAYDAMEWLMERFAFEEWRKTQWSLVPAGKVLEVGVGTGKNFPYHTGQTEVLGIDISERMLAQAGRKTKQMAYDLKLHQMDAQRLGFADNSFEAAVATFVFCSVPDAQRGLRELARVVKPGGKIVLLEHVRINRPPFLGQLMDWLDPLVVTVVGAHINRRTVENVKQAGLQIDHVEEVAPYALVKLILASVPA